MNISVSVSTAGLTLITSGSFKTVNDEPVQMSVVIGDEKTLSVMLHFHHLPNLIDRSIERQTSADGTIEEWHLYDSPEDRSLSTFTPVFIMGFEDDDGITKTIHLQLQSTRLAHGGPLQVDYSWWVKETKEVGMQ